MAMLPWQQDVSKPAWGAATSPECYWQDKQDVGECAQLQASLLLDVIVKAKESMEE